MSAQIKEALACLAHLYPAHDNGAICCDAAESVIRSALLAAQRESEAWVEIKKFLAKHGDDFELTVGLADEESEDLGEWLVRFVELSTDSDAGMRFPGDTRLEALEAAAKWCRAEMAK